MDFNDKVDDNSIVKCYRYEDEDFYYIKRVNFDIKYTEVFYKRGVVYMI